MPLNNIPSSANKRPYGAPAAMGGVNGFFPRLLAFYNLPNIPQSGAYSIPSQQQPAPTGSYQVNLAGPQIVNYQPVITNLSQFILPTQIQPLRETFNNLIWGPQTGDTVCEDRIDGPGGGGPGSPTIPSISLTLAEADPDAIETLTGDVTIDITGDDQYVKDISVGATTLDIQKSRLRFALWAGVDSVDDHKINLLVGLKAVEGSVDTIDLETCESQARFVTYDSTLIPLLQTLAVGSLFDVSVGNDYNISGLDATFDGLSCNKDFEPAVNKDGTVAYDKNWAGGDVPFAIDKDDDLSCNKDYAPAYNKE